MADPVKADPVKWFLFCAQIDGVSLRNVKHQFAVDRFHAAGNVVTLLVERGAEQRILVSLLGPVKLIIFQGSHPEILIKCHIKGYQHSSVHVTMF
jgi:hypothetical protein